MLSRAVITLDEAYTHHGTAGGAPDVGQCTAAHRSHSKGKEPRLCATEADFRRQSL